MLEWGLFSSAALLVGWIGTTALAAHQIALQVATVLFMVPFGISLAATVRVGHAVGRRDSVATRRAGFGAMVLGAVFMTAMTVIIVVLRNAIPLLFLGSDTDRAAETATLAATLLLVGATFFVNDGMQGIAAGALRGLNDTARADGVRRGELLADRLHQRLWIGVSRAALAQSASGSASRSPSPRSPCCWSGASTCCRRTVRGYYTCRALVRPDPTPAIEGPWWSACSIARARSRGDGVADTPAGAALRALHAAGRDRRGRALARPSRSPASAQGREREPRAHRADLPAFRNLRRLRAPASGARRATAIGSAPW